MDFHWVRVNLLANSNISFNKAFRTLPVSEHRVPFFWVYGLLAGIFFLFILQWPLFGISISFSFPYNWVGNNKSLDTQGLLLNSQAHTASRSFTVEQERPDFRQQITPFWVSNTAATVQKGQVLAKTCRNVPFHFFFPVRPCVTQCLHSSLSKRRGSGWFASGGSRIAWCPGQPRLLQEVWALAVQLRGKSFPPLTKLAEGH